MKLVIKLKGEIQSSNFSEWKNNLIEQIRSVNTKLDSDEDFVVAIGHVKLFKSAEVSLKEAKQSALNQASDIQKLFAAIDEIAGLTRQTRLLLERQIKSRKQTIKDECIKAGIDVVRKLISQQSNDFKLTDCTSYLDRNRFELAVKGKDGIIGIQSAIDNLCRIIKNEILTKSTEVKTNAIMIDSLPSKHKLLLQDRNSLLTMGTNELKLTIEMRIARLALENAKIKASNAIEELRKVEDPELNPESSEHNEIANIPEKQKFRIVIDIYSTKNTAIEIARSIRQDLINYSGISKISLNRNHDN